MAVSRPVAPRASAGTFMGLGGRGWKMLERAYCEVVFFIQCAPANAVPEKGENRFANKKAFAGDQHAGVQSDYTKV